MATCEHLSQANDPAAKTPEGCEECLAVGGRWVHLRRCLECGHIGCCDSSPGKHATKHFHDTSHPVIQSFERGEEWRWCFVDSQMG
ncbi:MULTISPECIES: UBP-type zinc finger domain-containing protein [unclassified Nonomuraea]|uniref:UBP-type zinc finger domain-containing protein n=1 Tax=unclassified Nonomuraea TaxID=2593643 RepID=UPI0032DBC05C